MTSTQMMYRQEEQDEREDPYMRLVYAIGILLTMFGHMIPGDVKWTFVGIALVMFYWIY
jgi:hypothetical protein